MRVLGVIPARCGSTRIPHKNLRMVGSSRLIDRAIHVAEQVYDQTPMLQWYTVSTDCVRLANSVAVDVPVFERRRGPDGPMVDVLLEVLAGEVAEGMHYDAVCCLQPTSPFRLAEDVIGCFELLAANPHAMSVVTVDELTRRRNGSVYLTRVQMLRDGKVFDDNSLLYPVAPERSIDINTPADIERAREIAKAKGW